MVSGVIVLIPMSLATPPVGRLVVKVLFLLRAAALVLAPMSLVLCVCLLRGVASTLSAAVQVGGPRSASVPVWPAKRVFPVSSVRWLAR